ncbi:hypothetical protein B0H11DRAFT_2064187 [Mycena galericulata]|nr:hypothetical protein B0H11DRAFT_2064187 [Mycena galericulata]
MPPQVDDLPCPPGLNDLSMNQFDFKDLSYGGHIVRRVQSGWPPTQGAYGSAPRVTGAAAVASAGAVAPSSVSGASLSAEDYCLSAGARPSSSAQPLAQSMHKKWASSAPRFGTFPQRCRGRHRDWRGSWGRSRALTRDALAAGGPSTRMGAGSWDRRWGMLGLNLSCSGAAGAGGVLWAGDVRSGRARTGAYLWRQSTYIGGRTTSPAA